MFSFKCYLRTSLSVNDSKNSQELAISQSYYKRLLYYDTCNAYQCDVRLFVNNSVVKKKSYQEFVRSFQ